MIILSVPIVGLNAPSDFELSIRLFFPHSYENGEVESKIDSTYNRKRVKNKRTVPFSSLYRDKLGAA